MTDTLDILRELATEIYFRAANARWNHERAALKGVQHAIENVLERHKVPTFERPKDGE